ncbi:MAG: 2-C-methyl-D-erythritol 4-phosphate cytidylyltransferase [Gemmatimonadales bacterium]|nr:2-C-methyl-D-erythritol 4-phosphate cytidylyltransferase [Gemmatimonadales bacterium]
MSSRRDVGVIVVAGGRGVRAGAGDPKQYRLLGKVPVLLRALRPFLAHPAVDRIVAVLPHADVSAPPEWLAPLVGDRLTLVAGGAERMASVEQGLSQLTATMAVVVVHDGARPFVDAAVIDAVILEARAGRGAVAAVPVSDTIKRSGVGPAGQPAIVETVSREGLWRAQTPQAFPTEVLRRGLAAARAAGVTVTDDAQAVESQGLAVVLVPDRPTNFKLTTPDDFALAEALLRGER